MKIAIDIHGTIDARTVFFSRLIKLLRAYGIEIHITTGVQSSIGLKEQLRKWEIEYDVLFSITDYHLAKGTKVTWDENGDPWIEESIWDRTKADYCKRNNVDLAIDDSEVYETYFDTPYIRFDRKKIKTNAEIEENNEVPFMKWMVP